MVKFIEEYSYPENKIRKIDHLFNPRLNSKESKMLQNILKKKYYNAIVYD